MSSFISRLDEYMTYAGLNDNQVTVASGMAVGCIGKARKSETTLSAVNIEKLLNAFEDINARWLITGEGEMLNISNVQQTNEDKLTNFILSENKELKSRVEQLLVENTRLDEQLKEFKKELVPGGTPAECADVKESPLAG